MTDSIISASGPTFLLTFWAVALLIIAVPAVGWWRTAPGATPAGKPTAEQAAYLTGGRHLAVYASLTALRAAGTVTAGDGYLSAAYLPPNDSTRLDLAVHGVAAKGKSVLRLVSNRQVVGAVKEIRASLARDRLLPPTAARAVLLLSGIALQVLALIGAVRLVAGAVAGQQVGYLLGSVLVVQAGALGLLLGARRRRTRQGSEVVREMRDRYRYLSPHLRPASSMYGPARMKMAVALYGPTALWTMDTAFASAAWVPPVEVTEAARARIPAPHSVQPNWMVPPHLRSHSRFVRGAAAAGSSSSEISDFGGCSDGCGGGDGGDSCAGGGCGDSGCGGGGCGE